jgi:hypothetical protein
MRAIVECIAQEHRAYGEQTKGGEHIHIFTTGPAIRFTNFMGSGLISSAMSNIFLGIRGLSLSLLILAAIGHADLYASIAGSGLPVSGLGRLGRDLVHREIGGSVSTIGDSVSIIGEISAQGRLRPPATSG